MNKTTLKVTLITVFTTCITSLHAQVPFSHTAQAISGKAERITVFNVSDNPYDRLEITNATQHQNKFIPQIWARRQSDERQTLGIQASIPSSLDTGSYPLMLFSTEIRNNINLDAPNGSEYPWGNGSDGLAMPIINRPLFAFDNAYTRVMTIASNNSVGIGTSTPTAKLHTVGNLRFEGLSELSRPKYYLTTDANGNVVLKTILYFSEVENAKSYQIQNALDVINQLNPITYTTTSNESTAKNKEIINTHAGFSQEELSTTLPHLSQRSSEQLVEYDEIIPYLTKAIKELSNEIETLKAQIAIKKPQDNNNKLLIYPNPSNKKITLQLNNKDIKTALVTIIDTSGAEIKRLNSISDNGKIELDISSLNAGLYICKVLDKNTIFEAKFIKK